MNDQKIITWVSLTDFAKRSGFCYSTFKKLFLWQLPEPQLNSGHQKKWSEDVVIECLEQIRSGEIQGKVEDELNDLA